MKRRVFTMKLQDGAAVEYRQQHSELWPELRELFRKAGVVKYSIFLEEPTNTLFAVQELSDDNTVAELREHPTVHRWWSHLADLMEVNEDDSPVCVSLTEVFCLED